MSMLQNRIERKSIILNTRWYELVNEARGVGCLDEMSKLLNDFEIALREARELDDAQVWIDNNGLVEEM